MICLQETWCLEKNGYPHMDIPGYRCASKYATCGDKGGVATYISDRLSFDIIESPIYSSNVWENLFVRVRSPKGGDSVIIGNIYRPPRDRADLLTTFRDEVKYTINSFENCQQMYLTGDYNLDLLKCDSNPTTNSFFELLCSSGYFPKILLPTRITSHSATLIDNVFCKHSKYFCPLQSGILSNRLSDHQPYFYL